MNAALAHPLPARIYTMPERSQTTDLRALRRAARHDERLSHQARHLFEDIVELSERDGHCSAGDGHFAEAFGVEKRTVRRWIAELREAGYIRVEGKTTARTITPSSPEVQSDLGHGLGRQGVLSEPSLGHDLGHSPADLGHSGAPSLGHPGADTKSISPPPEGEREARARTRVRGILGYEPDGLRAITANQPVAVALYTALVGRPPNAMWWPVISEGVGDDDAALRAWAETLAIWTSTHEPGSRKGGYNLGNVRGMLDAFGEARSKARGAHSSTNGGLRDLNALIAEEDRRGY